MSFLPIVQRELQCALRRKHTLRTRAGAGLVSLLLSGWIILTVGTIIVPEELGSKLFHILSTLAFYCCLTAGVVLTADCLSEEKRDGTLGLLFLTNLKGHDVIAGKLFATSLHAFYSLLAMLPALSLSFFLGGVTGGEFLRMGATLTSTLLLSLTVGALISTVSWHEHRSMVASAALLVSLSYALPATSELLAGLSPATALALVPDQAYQANPARFIGSLISQHSLSWLCVALSSCWIRRAWRENPPASPPGSNRSKPPSKPTRPGSLENPLTWLAHRTDRRAWIWGSLSLILLALTLTGARPRQFTAVIWMLALHATLQFWLAWEAGHRLNHDRRSGGLETILSTPLGPKEIVRAQIRSLKREFLAPAIVVIAGDFLLLLLSVIQSPGSPERMVQLITTSIAIILVLLVNLLAQASLGLWFGLRLTKASTATLATLLCVVLLPVSILMLVALAMATATPLGAEGLTALAAAWILIGGMCSAFFYRYAEDKLETGFRSAANRTFDLPQTTPVTSPAQANP